jgi:hypothetical protein
MPTINNFGEITWMGDDPFEGHYIVYSSVSGAVTPLYDGRNPIVIDSGQIVFYSHGSPGEYGLVLASPITIVPTISEWGMMILFALLAGSALRILARRGRKPI